MVSNNAHLYATIQALSNELRKAGEEEWSCQLTDAMSISTVTGEILGEIRLRLQKLEATQVPDVVGVKSQLMEALSYLNRIL